jgi:hypothetical protein
MREGAKRGCPMLASSPYESSAWILTKERIGGSLRERYQVPKELSASLLALVRKLDAVEGDQFREESSPATPSLLSKLDAVEGNQLLRACRTRLRALCRLQRFGSFT